MDRVDYNKVAPGAAKALYGVHTYLHTETELSKDLIDLVFLRVSQINGCAFCIDMHSRDLLKEGWSIDKVVLVAAWEESGRLFSDQERAALHWAETLTRVSETHVPDEDYAATALHFGEKDLADLSVAISLMNAYNRMGVGFRLKPAALNAL